MKYNIVKFNLCPVACEWVSKVLFLSEIKLTWQKSTCLWNKSSHVFETHLVYTFKNKSIIWLISSLKYIFYIYIKFFLKKKILKITFSSPCIAMNSQVCGLPCRSQMSLMSHLHYQPLWQAETRLWYQQKNIMS